MWGNRTPYEVGKPYTQSVGHANAKHSRTRAGFKRRNVNGRIGLRIPQAMLMEKGNRYKRGNKAIQRAELLNESDYTIMATY
jgi:hypothetical protein